MIKRLAELHEHLSDSGLKKEARALNNIIVKLSIKDDDISYKYEWDKKTNQEKQKIYNDIPSEKQAYEIAHHILDVIGLIPGPGDVADLINVFLYAKQGKYSLAAISLMCMIPAIGTAVGLAIKTGKKLPAKVVFEHEAEISKIVSEIKQYVPNSDKIAEAVNEITSQIKMGADSIDLSTGKAVKNNLNESGTYANNSLMSGGQENGAWYKNPKWIEWFSVMISSCLTKILNEVTEKETKTRLIKNIIYPGNRINIDFLTKNFNLEKKEIDEILNTIKENNDIIIKYISSQFVETINHLRKSIKFRILTSEADIAKYTTQKNFLAQADLQLEEIQIFLPRFSNLKDNPSLLVSELMSTIRHEVWHLVDYKFAEIFIKNLPSNKYVKKDFLSDGSNIYKIIYSNLNLDSLDNYGKGMKDYFSNPTELFVRIKSLREFLGNKNLTAIDLNNFRKLNIKDVENDIRLIHTALQGVKEDSLKIIADQMNKVI